jgi:hypothetical protein
MPSRHHRDIVSEPHSERDIGKNPHSDLEMAGSVAERSVRTAADVRHVVEFRGWSRQGELDPDLPLAAPATSGSPMND